MGRFIKQPMLMPATDAQDDFLLLSPFEYYFEGDAPAMAPMVPYADYKAVPSILVPPYFVTDMTSAPWIARVCNIDKFGPHGNAALLHDWVYSTEMFPRAVCDELFLEAMIVLGVGYTRRNAAYVGVRLGGGSVWAAHDPAEVAWWREYGRMCVAAHNNKTAPPMITMVQPLLDDMEAEVKKLAA